MNEVNNSYIDDVKQELENKKKTKEYQEKRKGFFSIIIYILGPMAFIPIIMAAIFSIALNSGSDITPDSIEVYALTYGLILFISLGILLWLAYYNRKSLKEQAKDFKLNLSSKLKYTIIAFIILFIFNLSLSAILNLLGLGEANNQIELENMMNSSGVFISLLSFGIVTPIVEEIVFRQSVIKVLRHSTKLDNLKINLIQALIFGLLHTGIGADLIFLPLYAGIGFILGSIYLKTNDNIYYSSIAHILNNVLGIVPLFFI